jgi:hypothetical protein
MVCSIFDWLTLNVIFKTKVFSKNFFGSGPIEETHLAVQIAKIFNRFLKIRIVGIELFVNFRFLIIISV